MLFNYWENILKNNNDTFIIKSWIDRSWAIDTKISFKEGVNKSITGIYKGIDKDGSIKVSVNGNVNNFYNLEAIE